MSFQKNLQTLRIGRNFTQERLAMLLGVSRQAISKWESGKAYPEMDKLLMICDLFGCTLDDLVLGDVTRPSAVRDGGADGTAAAAAAAAAARGAGMSDGGPAAGAESDSVPVPGPRPETEDGVRVSSSTGALRHGADSQLSSAVPQDLAGYDAHARRFSARIALGVAAIIAGAAGAALFDEGSPDTGSGTMGEFPGFLCLMIGVIVGLGLIIPAAMAHVDFRRRHPYLEDFYTDDDRSRASRRTAVGVVLGVGLILLGVAVTVYAEEVQGIEEGWLTCVMLLMIAAGVGCIVYVGVRRGLMSIEEYNKEAEKEQRERSGEQEPQERITGAVCGIIMIVATIVGLWMLFTGHGIFWLSWVFGGLCCGIASFLIQLIAGPRG